MRDLPPPPLCRDMAPEFVWAPQAKRMHQIMPIEFKIFFSTSEGAHPPQIHPVPTTGTEVLFLIWAPPLINKILDPPLSFKHKQGLQGRNFRDIKLIGG